VADYKNFDTNLKLQVWWRRMRSFCNEIIKSL
jgi:hypothetical protein